jgi:hypothetical protein
MKESPPLAAEVVDSAATAAPPAAKPGPKVKRAPARPAAAKESAFEERR